MAINKNLHHFKRGEQEAKVILQKYGYEFDESYCDDNSSDSMPDLRTKDGSYIEVTQTGHPNAQRIRTNGISLKNVSPQEYFQNLSKYENPQELNWNTEEYRVGSLSKPLHSAQTKKNEIRDIVDTIEHKALLRKKGIELFIFVAYDEFRLFRLMMDEQCLYASCLNRIFFSPFSKIYLCALKEDTLEFNTENPPLALITKTCDGVPVYYWLQDIKLKNDVE